jgi:hypothetical protein
MLCYLADLRQTGERSGPYAPRTVAQDSGTIDSVSYSITLNDLRYHGNGIIAQRPALSEDARRPACSLGRVTHSPISLSS